MPQDYLVAVKADKDPQLAAALKPKLAEVFENYQSMPESVAVVGKVGQGKSKLIEAILGIDQIAKSGGSGMAGTRVPIVYSPRRADSQVPYEAKVKVVCRRTCQDSVCQHLVNIMMSFERYEESSPQAEDQGSDSIIVLKNLFSDRPEFASEDSIRAFLGYDDDAPEPPSHAEQEIAFDNCIKWAEERRLKIDARSEIFTTDVTELWNAIAPFENNQTTTVDIELGFNPSSLVEKIEIFGNFRVRYSIGDCPGLEDINKDGETKANRYLQDCKVVIVVEDIIRAGVSDFLKRFLKDRHERRPDQRIIVVLSKSDTGLNPADRTNMSFKDHEIADLDWLAKRKEEVRIEKIKYEPTRFEERYRCAREITYIDLEEREICTRERSRRIEALLKLNYAKIAGEVTVMATCAHDYMRSIKGYCQFTDSDLPLSVESTGIPNLVRELADIANDRVKNDLMRLYGETLPELFSFVELVCSTTSTTVHSEPKFDFRKYEIAFMAQLMVTLDAFERKKIRPTEAAIQNATQLWKEEAQRCFLNKQGNHRTKTCPNSSWNRELLRPTHKTIDPLFKKLLKEVTFAMESLASHLEGDVDEFLKELHDATEYLHSKTFKVNLEDKRPQLKSMFRPVELSLRRSIVLIRGRITEDNNGDFFPRAMKKHYTAASQIKAIGNTKVTESRLRALEDRVCGFDSPYEAIHTSLRLTWRILKERCIQIGQKAITANMEEIKASYKHLGTPKRRDSAVTMMRADLERSIAEGKEQWRGAILASLYECGLDPPLKIMKR